MFDFLQTTRTVFESKVFLFVSRFYSVATHPITDRIQSIHCEIENEKHERCIPNLVQCQPRQKIHHLNFQGRTKAKG